MANISKHESSKTVKLLLLGDAATGKTGSLASLANAGYKLRILDFDNNLGSMIDRLKPESISRVDFETLKPSDPKSYDRASALMKEWKTTEGSLGRPSEWGPDEVLVFDSMSFFGDACLSKAKSMGGNTHMQAVYGTAQDLFKDVIREALYTLPCNIVCTSHMQYQEEEGIGLRCYPKAVSRGLNTEVPKYFNNIWLIEAKSDGKRLLKTSASTRMALRSSAPSVVKPEEELDLGSLFKKITENSRRVLDTSKSPAA